MREIPLTKNYVAFVDDEDYEYLSQFSWQAMSDPCGVYAGRKKTIFGRNQTTIRMHREVMRAEKGQIVDHKNRNTLDNRKENLRICTARENQFNSGPKSEISGYKGVTWHKRICKWQARIRKGNDFFHLGYFTNKHSAAVVYNYCAKIIFGEFAFQNEIKIEELMYKSEELE